MGIRQVLLGPDVMRASVIAYDAAIEIVVGTNGNRRELSDALRSDLASAIISLAETGVTDPKQLMVAALARVNGAARLVDEAHA